VLCVAEPQKRVEIVIVIVLAGLVLWLAVLIALLALARAAAMGDHVDWDGSGSA
jgi:hypothetical protein